MFTFEIYENAVENSSKIFSFKNEKEIHKDLFEILEYYQRKYPITTDDIINACSWAELATVGEDFVLNEITIIASDDEKVI